MGFKEQYNFSLIVNEVENVVIEELEKLLKTEEYKGICKCEECVLDMVAYALNNIKPKYRATLTGAIYTRELYTEENRKKISDEVKKAIEKISKNPSHML